MGLGAVRVGAGQQHEHVGPGREGAPRLDAVDHPAAVDRRGRGDDAGDVGAEVGLGDRHRGQDLARWPAWAATACFCSSVPPVTRARLRISGRVMSEPPTPSEPQTSSSVATTMPR